MLRGRGSRLRERARRRLIATAIAIACALGMPAAAAAKVWIVKGAGFGHGVGMSQYGAKGFAQHGIDYQTILAHYYTGTTIAATTAMTVRVLLRSAVPSVSFRGASSACDTGLKTGKTYVARRKGVTGIALRTKKGARVLTCSGPINATGPGSIEVLGKGTYHGSMQILASTMGGRVSAINFVSLEDYVRGVVPKESPSSFPPEALKAQAVAARSYALAVPVRGTSFDQYDDTRSQVYGGASAETTKTDAAVDATAGQVVMYAGRVAQTFFFSTSGGHTENNEFSSLGFGQPPVPYLRGVDDPFEAEAGSPYEHWKRKFSFSRMNSALGGLARGKVRSIVVTQRGSSPRIVHANVISSGGTTTVTGPQLRDALGLPDTWAFFKKK